jgi:protein-disulfide isomerase
MKRSVLMMALGALVLVVLIAAGAWLLNDQNTNLAANTRATDTRPPADEVESGSAPQPTGTEDAANAEIKARNIELLTPGTLEEQVIGSDAAPVTIVEYASLTCTHCAEFHEKTWPTLKANYIDTGKVRFIFREFPLDEYAIAGFMLARCSDSSKYFDVVEAFFNQLEGLITATEPPAWIQNFARQVGFTDETLKTCVSNTELEENIKAVRQRASEKFGVNSTPTFFINGKIHRGAMTVEKIEQEIKDAPKM